MNPHTTVSIPRVLADKIKVRIEGTDFPSISAYVTHLLTELEDEIDKLNSIMPNGV